MAADGEMLPMFSAKDALEVARHLQESPSVVLVGGQSLNFWAEQLRDAVPELERLAPFQSSDVDFLGTVQDVQTCARRLGGKVAYPSPDQFNTPEVGVVYCILKGNRVKIDFLGYLAGLDSHDIRKAAIPAEMDGVVLRVMHPINVLRSRVANVVQLRRRDSLALRQTRVAIHIAAEYTRRVGLERPRTALNLIEEVFDIACSKEGIRVWYDHGIDVFDAARSFGGLPTEFAKKRLPQMQAHLSEKRDRYKTLADSIAERKAKKK